MGYVRLRTSTEGGFICQSDTFAIRVPLLSNSNHRSPRVPVANVDFAFQIKNKDAPL